MMKLEVGKIYTNNYGWKITCVYNFNNGESLCVCEKPKDPIEFIYKFTTSSGLLPSNSDFRDTYCDITGLWQEPKKKKKLKMVAWLDDEDEIRWFVETPDDKTPWQRIPDQDFEIEVEE